MSDLVGLLFLRSCKKAISIAGSAMMILGIPSTNVRMLLSDIVVTLWKNGLVGAK
jgi:hypothetical protein